MNMNTNTNNDTGDWPRFSSATDVRSYIADVLSIDDAAASAVAQLVLDELTFGEHPCQWPHSVACVATVLDEFEDEVYNLILAVQSGV